MPSEGPDRIEGGDAARQPWLNVELRHLAALEAVADERSFAAAAARLGYVQSAVSQQLAHLEAIVGARLVERRRGVAPVAVTEAGALLLRHYAGIRAELGAARADLDAISEGRAGTVRVGIFELVATHLVPAILRGLAERFPRIDVRMEEAPGPVLASLVQRGDLDLAFASPPVPPGPFGFRLLRAASLGSGAVALFWHLERAGPAALESVVAVATAAFPATARGCRLGRDSGRASTRGPRGELLTGRPDGVEEALERRGPAAISVPVAG